MGKSAYEIIEVNDGFGFLKKKKKDLNDFFSFLFSCWYRPKTCGIYIYIYIFITPNIEIFCIFWFSYKEMTVHSIFIFIFYGYSENEIYFSKNKLHIRKNHYLHDEWIFLNTKIIPFSPQINYPFLFWSLNFSFNFINL